MQLPPTDEGMRGHIWGVGHAGVRGRREKPPGAIERYLLRVVRSSARAVGRAFRPLWRRLRSQTDVGDARYTD